MIRGRLVAGVTAAVVMAGGCSSPPRAVTYGDCSQLTVFAASSLTTVFPKVANTLQPGCANSIRFQFAGTDALAAQLEQGARADVFAGASATFDEELVSKRLIDQPRFFATNRLVVVVPPSNPGAIRSIGDLAKPGLKLVIGGPTVPVGAYTRKVLASLDAVYGSGFSGRVLANVVSNEDSVSNVMAKVQLGEADAGFVYVTDARAAAGKVATIELPAEAQAIATYPIAAVTGGANRGGARLFIGAVLSPDGQKILRAAGFGPPPAGP